MVSTAVSRRIFWLLDVELDRLQEIDKKCIWVFFLNKVLDFLLVLLVALGVSERRVQVGRRSEGLVPLVCGVLPSWQRRLLNQDRAPTSFCLV